MNKRQIFLMVTLSLVLTGCGATATLVKHPTKPLANELNPKGFELNDDGVGIVSYKAYGSEDRLLARRDKAEQLASQVCGGNFNVIEERSLETYDRFNNATTPIQENSFKSEHNYVIFNCDG